MKKNATNTILLVFIDILLSVAVVLFTFLGYYSFQEFSDNITAILIYTFSISLLTVIFFFIFKIYRIISKEIGIYDSLRIMLVTLLVHVIGLLAIAFVPQLPSIGSFIFSWVLSTISLVFLHTAVRHLIRIIQLSKSQKEKKNKIRTIVIGAGSMGKVAIDETRRNKNNKNLIVAVVDDDVNKIGGLFANIPVKGPISEISEIIDFYKAEEVIIAISNITEERLHEILSLLEATNVRVKRMPLISEMNGPNEKHFIDVDLDDLLAREPIKLDNHQVKEMLHGKVVLVTGAGGSIGQEVVRQIFNVHPKTLILFDIYENTTYDIQMELKRRISKENITDIELVTLIGSTYDEFRVETIIKQYRPDYIYHAAAYKHVPLMEDSPAEAIRSNVIGTYNVARCADKYGVKKMVLISTDKAVRPKNVMGATKRFAEIIIQYFSSISKNTKYAAVRFGNVLGSNGSVVPLFKKQIEDGGPITLTHKDIIRFFMTIPEAVSLILQCGLFAEGGEIFILDMGKPVKILHLAERLIRQAGLIPYVDIDIVETGLRPGEKLYEEILLDKNKHRKTSNSKIFVEDVEKIDEHLEEDVKEASLAFKMEKTSDVKELLAKLITTYTIDKR